MTDYVDTREGWRKIAKDEPIAGGEEQIHRYWLKRPVDSMLQVDIWVKDPDYKPSTELPLTKIAELIAPYVSTRFVEGSPAADDIESVLNKYGVSLRDGESGPEVSPDVA